MTLAMLAALLGFVAFTVAALMVIAVLVVVRSTVDARRARAGGPCCG